MKNPTYIDLPPTMTCPKCGSRNIAPLHIDRGGLLHECADCERTHWRRLTTLEVMVFGRREAPHADADDIGIPRPGI